MHYSVQLTQSQAAYAQTLLPQKYSIQVAVAETKRQRSARKIDDLFTTDYGLNTKRTSSKQNANNFNQKSEQKDLSQFSEEEGRGKQNPAASKVLEDVQRVEERKGQQTNVERKELNELSLMKLLEKLKSSRCSWPFRLPVDPVGQGVPNYLEVVKEPMDLRTIQRKLKLGSYSKDQELHADIRKIISNSLLFNPKDSSYYTITQQFEALYLKTCQELCKNTEGEDDSRQRKEGQFSLSPEKKPQRKGKEEKKQSNTATIKQPSNPKPTTKPTATMTEKLTFRQRQKLFHQIYELSQTDIISLIKIFDSSSLQKDWREFQIDFKDIDDDKFKKIVNLVKERS